MQSKNAFRRPKDFQAGNCVVLSGLSVSLCFFFVSLLDMPVAMLAAVRFAVVFTHDLVLYKMVVSCFVFLSR